MVRTICDVCAKRSFCVIKSEFYPVVKCSKYENTNDIKVPTLDEKKHKCGSAKSCEYGDMCKPSYDIGGCSHYREKRPQTNEEWLRSCTTMELAEFIRKQRDDWSDGWYSDCHRFEEIVEWLKEKHNG